MFCPKCSHENPDGTNFCGKCGTRLVENGFRSFLKGFVSSPLFLSLCIVLSVVIALRFLGASDAGSVISDVASQELNVRIEPVVAFVSFFSVAFSSAPQIVLLIGLWLLYAWGKKPCVDDRISGLGVVRAYVIIGEVVSYIAYIGAIVALSLLILAVSFMNVIDPFYFSNGFDFELGRITLAILLSVFLAVFIVLFVLTILYYAKLRRILKDTRELFKTGVGKIRCSSYVAVIQYIIATVLFIMAIPEVFTTGMTGFLTTLAMGAFDLLVAIILSVYKKETERR